MILFVFRNERVNLLILKVRIHKNPLPHPFLPLLPGRQISFEGQKKEKPLFFHEEASSNQPHTKSKAQAAFYVSLLPSSAGICSFTNLLNSISSRQPEHLLIPSFANFPPTHTSYAGLGNWPVLLF